MNRETESPSKATVKTAKVMIVDDSFLMRSILKNILQKDPVFKVVAEAANGEDAIALLEKSADPDIILLDIEMPIININL